MNTHLVQTHIPAAAHDLAQRLADRQGVSVAAWLRGLIYRETKYVPPPAKRRKSP